MRLLLFSYLSIIVRFEIDLRFVGYYPILPFDYPNTEELPFCEVFLRVLQKYGIVIVGVISKTSGLHIRYMISIII